MSNPLYTSFTNPTSNISEFTQKLNQLKQTFSGNPQQTIQQMLNSGKITQEQFNNAAQQAQQIMKLFGRH